MPDRAPPRAAAQAVLRARVALERIGDLMLPAEISTLNRSIGFAPAFVMRALLVHEVPEALGDRRRTAKEIAAERGLDPDALHRVMRLAALYGLLKLDKRGRFRLTRTGRVLKADHKHTMRDWILYLTEPTTQQAWASVIDSVRTGEPAFPATFGESIWSYFEKHPREERQFAGGMRRITEIDLPSIVAGYPWPERGTVCDVAGGVGTLLAGVLKARPALKGVLVDGKGVLAEAEEHLRAAGVRDRVELSPGNFFESVTAKADVYVMKDILHDWDDERCLQILRTTRRAMPPGSRLVLVEQLQERNEVAPVASFVDVLMLAQTDGGRQRSVAELHALLRQADLEPGEVRLTANPGLVEGIAR
jgi:hypothetical protein